MRPKQKTKMAKNLADTENERTRKQVRSDAKEDKKVDDKESDMLAQARFNSNLFRAAQGAFTITMILGGVMYPVWHFGIEPQFSIMNDKMQIISIRQDKMESEVKEVRRDQSNLERSIFAIDKNTAVSVKVIENMQRDMSELKSSWQQKK